MKSNTTPKIHFKSKLLYLFPRWVTGFTLGQHIFLKHGPDKVSRRLVAHEKIHCEQYKEHGILKFLWIYFFKEWRLKYREKTFEIEAYSKTDHLSQSPIED